MQQVLIVWVMCILKKDILFNFYNKGFKMQYFRQTKTRINSFHTNYSSDWDFDNAIEISEETYTKYFEAKKCLYHNFDKIESNQKFTIFKNCYGGNETITEFYTIN